MATAQERLAALEAHHRELSRRVDELDEALNGGTRVEWNQSIRGKIHYMQSALASADKMRAAAEAAVRAQREATHTVEVAHGRRLSRWAQIVLVVCAIVTCATPYVLHFTA